MALVRIGLVALISAVAATSLPIEIPQKPLTTRHDQACESIDRFTMEWFLSNTKPEYRQEIVGKALFYTAGAAEAARSPACGSDDSYVTIWQICR